MPRLDLRSMPSHIIRRCIYAGITAVAVIVALALLSAHERARVQAHDAAMQNAWQATTPTTAPPLTREALLARFAVRQASATGDLSWQVASLAELRASLLAFDLAQIRLTQVKVARNGAGFAVTAERAP